MDYLLIKIINLDRFLSRINSINMLNALRLLFPYLIPKYLEASFQLLQIQMTAGKVKC